MKTRRVLSDLKNLLSKLRQLREVERDKQKIEVLNRCIQNTENCLQAVESSHSQAKSFFGEVVKSLIEACADPENLKELGKFLQNIFG